MKYIFENLALAPELKNGEIWCSTYLSSEDGNLLPLGRALINSRSGEKNNQVVEIEVHFALKRIVTERIESFQYGCSQPPMINLSNRPLLEALRKELADMMALLGSVEYVED